MFYAKGQYGVEKLESLTKDNWLKLSNSTRADIRLALSQSIVYCKGEEKTRLMNLKSKFTKFSME